MLEISQEKNPLKACIEITIKVLAKITLLRMFVVFVIFSFMGMLFYYHTVEGMCDFVFVDRQWLFDKLTELVEIKFTKGCNEKYVNAEEGCRGCRKVYKGRLIKH